MSGTLIIRNVTSVPLHLNDVERIGNPTVRGWRKFKPANLRSSGTNAIEPGDETALNQQENLHIEISPFTVRSTQIEIGLNDQSREDKDRILRLYVNYRSLNKIIIKNRYTLLLINKILNYLSKIKYFIKLDFKDIYYYI